MKISVFIILSFCSIAVIVYSQEQPPSSVSTTVLSSTLTKLTTSVFQALQKNEPIDIERIQKARTAIVNSNVYPSAEPFHIAAMSLLAIFTTADLEHTNSVAEYVKVKNQKNINSLRSDAEFEKTKQSRLAMLNGAWERRTTELRAAAEQQLAKCQALLSQQPQKVISSNDTLFALLYESPIEMKGKALAAINESEIYIRTTTIIQIDDDGVIMGGMNASDKKGHFIGSAERWYLVGFDASNSTDGANIGRFKVYHAGTYRYTTVQGSSRTVPRYAASPELALKLLLADQLRKKEDSDGESKPKLPQSY